MSRKTKIAFISFIYLFIIGVVSVGLYFLISPDPTCNDGKQNQNEKGIDCGGRCTPCNEVLASVTPLNVVKSDYMYGGNDAYDALIEISNPNLSIGSSNFSYNIILLDGQKNKIGSRKGTNFILPAENKYIIETNIAINGENDPSSIEIEILDTEWKELFNYQKPQLNIFEKRFEIVNNESLAKAYGVLKNQSGFDFNTINVNIILRDAFDRPLGVNSTVLNTVRSNEERDFTLSWPYDLKGEVEKIEMEAEADVYDSDNFLKAYSSGERMQFQSY